MSRQRHQLAKEIFLEACALRPDERLALLDERCAGDTALRAEIEAQLAADDDPIDLTGAGARAQLEQALGAAAAVGPAPVRIGRYRVLGLLGEGGMGAVYEAEQDSPRRRVAIKLLRPGAAAPALVRRFEREAEALGQLQHPGVAQIYEAGVADVQWPQGPASHQPFFAMELAPGTPLDSYARVRNLDLAARLELVARVCDAVQHAHAKGVIHRDLKPANILVAEDEQGRAAPKILDFGVARLTESDAHALTMRTEAGQIIGTLPYMSPEQVAGDTGQVDTRTDVYALGVILYELLAGRLPLDVGGSSVAEAARIICDHEPRTLSAHDSRCRGDVETIVARALEKDPARRYQSPGELAADIRRFLRDEPIQARPPSAAYQLRKFARRNRALVAGAGAALAALVLGLGVAIAQAWRLSLARDREQTAKVEAQEQAAIATAVNSVLLQIVEAPDPFDLTPISDVPLDVRVSDVLARVATGAEQLSGSPRARAAVHSALATTYRGLGDPAAVEHARLALALLQDALGAEHEESLRCAHELAASLVQFDQREEAVALVETSRHLAERAIGAEHWLTLRLTSAHARLLLDSGELARAEALARACLAAQERLFGTGSRETIVAMLCLGRALYETDRLDEAAQCFGRAIEIGSESYGAQHPLTTGYRAMLAAVLDRQGRLDEAEQIKLQVLATWRHLLGDDHARTQTALSNLATAYSGQGRNTEAEPLFADVLSYRRRRLGDDHSQTLTAMNNLAAVRLALGRPAEAQPLIDEAVERARTSLPPRHWRLGVFLKRQGEVLAALDRPAEARRSLEESVTILSAALGQEHQATQAALDALATLSHEPR